MKPEEPIATLIHSLEAAKQQAIAVSNAFPDAVAKVVGDTGLRYHSESLNECADKAEFGWKYLGSRIDNKLVLNIMPYTELPYEFDGNTRAVKIHTEPFEIEIASKINKKISVKNYESILSDLKFNQHIVRLTDIHISYGIINDKWDVDRDELSEKVKLFLTFN